MQRRLSSDVQVLHCSVFWRIVCRQLRVIYNNRLIGRSVILGDSQSHTRETRQSLWPATGFEGRLNVAGMLLQDAEEIMLCTSTAAAIQELPNLNKEWYFAGAGDDWYTCWKAWNWNRVYLSSHVNSHVLEFKQESGILTFSPWSICQALHHPDPKEDLLCVLCAACPVSHLSPLTNDREQLRLTGSFVDLCSTVQWHIGNDVVIPQIWLCPFCPTVQS